MNIYPFFSLQFFAYFSLFLFSAYISFYLPGALILSRKKLGLGLGLLLSFCLGIALWGFQGYIFGFLHTRFLTYVYLGTVIFLAYKYKLFSFTVFSDSLKWIKKNPLIVLLVLVGILVQYSSVIGSGLLYKEGVRFFGVNRADGIMHIAFIQSMTHYFPPIEPGSYGHLITNYHFWSDMMISDLVRVWRLPISHTFFQYLPPLISSLTALAGYLVVRKLGFSKSAGIWSIFFLFFAGDATFALGLIFLKKLTFMTPALDNGASIFLNMPNALARLLFLSGIISLKFWLEERARVFWGIVTILIFASLVGVKVYYGIFVILGLGLVISLSILNWLIRNNKSHGLKVRVHKTFEEQKYLALFGILLCVISALIFIPANKSAGGVGWYPLEWSKIFLGADVLNWQGWFLRMQVYEAAHNSKAIIFYDALAILITLFCVHGTRLLGLLPSREIYRKLGREIVIFLIPGLIIFHVLGLFTLQASGGLNVFNFFVVATVVMSILSGMLLDNYSLSLKKPFITIFLLILIILTVPRVAYEVVGNIQALMDPKNNSFLVTNAELSAFKMIREVTPQNYIIQSHPNNAQDTITPYVAFFSDRLSFLTGTQLQETHNQPLSARENKLKDIFTSKDPVSFFGQARAAGINILYLKKDKEEELIFNPDTRLFTKLYENKEVVVYRINIYL